MDWILFLIVFTLVNKLLIFSLFWFKKNNSTANKLLSLLILFSAIPILSNYIIYSGGVQQFPHFIFIYQIFANMVGPAFFFYCMEMIGRPFVLNRNKLLHLIPAIFPLIFWIDFLYLPALERQEFVANYLNADSLNWRMIIASITPPLFALPYFLIASRQVYKYTSTVKKVYTDVEKLKTKYIREFVSLMLAELLALFVLYAFCPVKDVEMIWLPILNNIYYFYVVYKAYNYSVIFSEKDYQEYLKLYSPLTEYIEEKKQGKYTSSILSDEKIIEYSTKLKQGFIEERWYLEPELNLRTLSQKSGIPAHYISQVINQQFGMSFFDYVNSCRVEELKRNLLDISKDNITIEGLAYMSGFNSKAAFQRAFKKHIGMSPKEYRKTYTVAIN